VYCSEECAKSQERVVSDKAYNGGCTVLSRLKDETSHTFQSPSLNHTATEHLSLEVLTLLSVEVRVLS
jgi:hypothetical protein